MPRDINQSWRQTCHKSNVLNTTSQKLTASHSIDDKTIYVTKVRKVVASIELNIHCQRTLYLRKKPRYRRTPHQTSRLAVPN